MSELLEGYQHVPEEDRRKAKVFFDRAQTVAGTGNFEYAIELYLQGLDRDPEAVEAHQALREISLKRKASGGKAIGFLQAMSMKRGAKEDKQALLTAEKLLAYDPGNTDHMLAILLSAYKAGCYDTVMWIGPILQKAESELPERKQDAGKFLSLKNVYHALGQWKLATDACQSALALRPDDMDLQTELKNLGALHTMSAGKYNDAVSFRDSVKDMDAQRRLLEQDMDVRSEDLMSRQISEAEAEWKAQPDEPGKIMRLVGALVRTENAEHESRAMEILAQAYERTKQFRFRRAMGSIKLVQLNRAERALREKVAKNPADEALREEYRQFVLDKTEEELKEFTLWAENYPTDLGCKYEMARRLFMLDRFSEAIPVFQTARQDPKYRVDASTYLGRAFLDAGFTDEAVDTLRQLIEEYELKGDPKSKDMNYWYGRALEQHNDTPAALKCYSQVAQWDFNYRDVQSRIKRLRSGVTQG